MAHGNKCGTGGAEEHFCKGYYSVGGAWVWNIDDDDGQILDEGNAVGFLLYDSSFSLSWNVVCKPFITSIWIDGFYC